MLNRRDLIANALPAALVATIAPTAPAAADSEELHWDGIIRDLCEAIIAQDSTPLVGKLTLVDHLGAALESEYEMDDDIDEATYDRLSARLDALSRRAHRRRQQVYREG